jgi:hypothetical protein
LVALLVKGTDFAVANALNMTLHLTKFHIRPLVNFGNRSILKMLLDGSSFFLHSLSGHLTLVNIRQIAHGTSGGFNATLVAFISLPPLNIGGFGCDLLLVSSALMVAD